MTLMTAYKKVIPTLIGHIKNTILMFRRNEILYSFQKACNINDNFAVNNNNNNNKSGYLRR